MSEDIKEHVGADSLAYLSIDGMLAATQVPADGFCTACFSSDYPVTVPAHELRNKLVLERPSKTEQTDATWRTEMS